MKSAEEKPSQVVVGVVIPRMNYPLDFPDTPVIALLFAGTLNWWSALSYQVNPKECGTTGLYIRSVA